VKLQELAGAGVTVTANQPIRPVAKPPALDPKIVGPMKTLAARYFPGVPVLPLMSTGATDGVFLESIGIPVYGAPGMFVEKDNSGTHGLNERVLKRSLYDARDYLYDLVRVYAG
jgi:acetylornithine deacetylase/succinyl-diaminopimelate desuccinylase-like protein